MSCKNINTKDFRFKLKWWAKEHLLFCHANLGKEEILEYKLPPDYQDFVVHPCVRYIPEGIGGYTWWMVLTPYQDYDVKKENILLFHGKDNPDNRPPKEWVFVKEICGSHNKGYNSDPCLYYDGIELWIIWREWETENLPAGVPSVCIMCSKTCDGKKFTPHIVIASNEFNEYSMIGDTAMCPIVLSYKGKLCLYATVYSYKPYLRPIGVSRYLFDDNYFRMDGFYHKDNLWFDLWHFDLFELKGYLYQVVTGQFGNAIYIGRSEDGKIFKYSKKPLYSNLFFVKKNYFYKASVQVLGNYIYVFYPRKRKNGSVRITMRSMDISELEKMKYQ